MSRYSSIPFALCAALVCAKAPNAGAQAANPVDNTRPVAVFPLPNGVEKLVASDAHSSLLAVTAPDETSDRTVHQIMVRHVYPGGIAQLFGGTVIPAAQLVTPALDGANSRLGDLPISFVGMGPNGFGPNELGQIGFGNRPGRVPQSNFMPQNGFVPQNGFMPQNNNTPQLFRFNGMGQ